MELAKKQGELRSRQHRYYEKSEFNLEIVSSIVVLRPGMYILRHPKNGLPPLTVSRAAGSAVDSGGRIEMVATPNTHGAILRDGSDCIVVHVMDKPVEFLVTAYMAQQGAAVPSIKVDQISLDAAPAPVIQKPAETGSASSVNQSKQIEISAKGLTVIGHLEVNGDVVAAEGQYLGDPASNLRLEGFQVMWPDRPEGVDLVYGVALEGVGQIPMVKTGKFCGRRAEARRITEVTFALTGPKADQFRLDGTACFSGGFQVPVASGIALSGPSGLEHLTSIALRALPSESGGKPVANPWAESPKTKVFKVNPLSNQPSEASQNPAVSKAAGSKKTASGSAKAKR
jgi:hypothetical protein